MPADIESSASSEQGTTCIVAGGGPAGIMLGLLLARGGVDVTVMEKHADFLRDFRGDTVHASTLRLLDELGLASEFARMPHREIDTLTMSVQGTEVNIDLSRIPGPHKHIALVPQWDFLELLAAAAEKEPTFRLLRSTEVLGPIMGAGTRKDKVIGVRYRGADGEVREMHAALTVACDGRSSTLRTAMGLRPRSFGAPMDVWWFRLPRNADDPHGLAGVLGTGAAQIVIDRGDYYQCAYVIPKGRDAELRAQGIEALHRGVVALVPWLADHIAALTSFDDVKLLDVQLNRLRRWYCRRAVADRRRRPCDVPGRRGGDQPRGRRCRRGGANARGPVAGGQRLHQAFGPHSGPAVAARGADPGGAARRPQPGHRRRRDVEPAGRQTAAAGADRRQVPAAAHRGWIRDRDRAAARTRAEVCPALTEPAAGHTPDKWTPGRSAVDDVRMVLQETEASRGANQATSRLTTPR